MKEIKEPSEIAFDPAEALAARTYASFQPGSGTRECFIIVGRGAFAFRYGPFTSPEAGKILEWSVRERVVVTLVMNCGTPFDFELAKDMGLKMILPEDRMTPKGWIIKLIKKFTRKTGEPK